MNVLIGCECTGTIRDAFLARGHNAYSCDILPDQKGNTLRHYQMDILQVLRQSRPGDWDLFIVHPDCTYLTCAAEWCYKEPHEINKKLDPDKLYGADRKIARITALHFVRDIMYLSKDIPRFGMENPGYNKINTEIMRPTQFIQPYDFGHDASKKTGLWLRGLPKLERTKYIHPRWTKEGLPRWGNQTDSGQNKLGPSDNRWLLRAATYQGWADAMAEQWGGL